MPTPRPGPSPLFVRRLTRTEVPDGTALGVFGDLHIGCHDAPAANLMVECFDRVGVDIVIPNGDIHDCGPVAPHEMKARTAAATNGQLLEEAYSGREYVDWMRTRRLCLYGEGNHEDWINDVAVRNNAVGSITVANSLDLPVGPAFEVLPHGYQIRLGSLVIEHGDIVLGRGSGGANLARSILNRYPTQTTVVNHFHRDDYAVRTAPDAGGVPRSHAAVCLGHMSDPSAHADYAGRAPNWQQGFGLIRVWYDAGKPRFTVDSVEIHRTRRGHPVFEYGGHVYR